MNSTYIVLGFNDWGGTGGGAKVLSLIYTDGSNTTLTSDGVKVEAYKIPTTLHIETGGHSKLFYVVVVTTDFSAGISPTSQNGRWWYGGAAGDVVTYHLTVYAKDGLTGQALTGVTVKDGSGNVWTVNDGTSIEIPAGSHTLTFEKTGYWSTTATVDVQNDTSLFVVMYPSSAAFKFENFPSDISIPENTIYTLTFTFSPITTDATYNTYLSISGLSDLIEVQKDGSVISPNRASTTSATFPHQSRSASSSRRARSASTGSL
ncbi:hypothetical protein [Thermococcus sp. JCM 11816]|uniref:hypothetical protein n=1 Tax=Thermococcus sp. (strain JCM 11816 / KS-1) TaxID=1295125 RepID=UPI0006D15C3B